MYLGIIHRSWFLQIPHVHLYTETDEEFNQLPRNIFTIVQLCESGIEEMDSKVYWELYSMFRGGLGYCQIKRKDIEYELKNCLRTIREGKDCSTRACREISGIHYDRLGFRYEVRYFVEGGEKYAYFEPDELIKDTDDSGCGFGIEHS